MQKLQAFRDSSGVSGGDGTAEEDVLFLTDPIPDEIHVAAEAASGLEPASHQYDLLLITKDAGLWERLSAHFAEEGQFKLRQLQGRVAEHEARVADIKLPDIALIDLNKGDMLDINALERLKRSRFSNVPIVATSSCLDQTLVRGLMRIKVDDWLPANSMPAEFKDRAKRPFACDLPRKRRGTPSAPPFCRPSGEAAIPPWRYRQRSFWVAGRSRCNRYVLST